MRTPPSQVGSRLIYISTSRLRSQASPTPLHLAHVKTLLVVAWARLARRRESLHCEGPGGRIYELEIGIGLAYKVLPHSDSR